MYTTRIGNIAQVQQDYKFCHHKNCPYLAFIRIDGHNRAAQCRIDNYLHWRHTVLKACPRDVIDTYAIYTS